ncbi:MAG: hypothetical protein ACFFFT_15720 [Candidatus Thorarchaeota archaeon]
MKVIATNKDDIGISAIDFFSFTHMIIGYLIFIVLNGILFVMYSIPLGIFSLMYTFFIAIIWESLENTVFYYLGIKFARRRDSLINSLTDICFFSSGGLIALFNTQYGGFLFLIYTIFLFMSIILLTSFYLAKILEIKKIMKKIFRIKKFDQE